MEPKIVTKEEFRVVGLHYYGDNSKNEIPELWNDLCRREHEMPPSPEGEIWYGVCWCESENCGGKFNYLAARCAAKDAPIPQGMAEFTVPSQKYAVFEHHGSLDTLHKSYVHIMNVEMKNRGMQFASMISFELYDKDFKYGQPDSVMYIYMPIK
jgi:AraC family transcriptional regulator